jgi:hypothetical protein
VNVFNRRGRIIGNVQSSSALLQEQLDIVRDFLITLKKGPNDEMAEKSENKVKEKTNMVFLAGNLKFDPKIFDNNIRALIDVGLKSSIQVSIYTGADTNQALAEKMKRFRAGDFIRIVAMLRPYGTKQDDNSWKNNLSIDVTEIKTDPPQRQSRRDGISDDDIPY